MSQSEKKSSYMQLVLSVCLARCQHAVASNLWTFRRLPNKTMVLTILVVCNVGPFQKLWKWFYIHEILPTFHVLVSSGFCFLYIRIQQYLMFMNTPTQPSYQNMTLIISRYNKLRFLLLANTIEEIGLQYRMEKVTSQQQIDFHLVIMLIIHSS